jgi:Ca-activated chloride channel homolog
VALAALLPAAARAQESGARTPVVGGGSFNTAPLLQPGRYRDTILPDEFLYYGIALKAGQRLHVRARIASSDWESWNASISGFAVNLATPLRELVTNPVAEDVLGNSNAQLGPVAEENMASQLRWDFFGPPAVPLAEALEQDVYDGPGVWFLAFNAITAGQHRLAEFPVEFDLDVEGEAQAEPPDPTPRPTATPTPGPDDASGDDDGGPGLGALAGLGVVGLAAGLVLGGALARRRRS